MLRRVAFRLVLALAPIAVPPAAGSVSGKARQQHPWAGNKLSTAIRSLYAEADVTE